MHLNVNVRYCNVLHIFNFTKKNAEKKATKRGGLDLF